MPPLTDWSLAVLKRYGPYPPIHLSVTLKNPLSNNDRLCANVRPIKDLEFKYSPELHLSSCPTLHFLFHAHRLVIEAKNLLRDNFFFSAPAAKRMSPRMSSRAWQSFWTRESSRTACSAFHYISIIPNSNRDIGSVCGLIFIRTRKRKHGVFNVKNRAVSWWRELERAICT